MSRNPTEEQVQAMQDRVAGSSSTRPASPAIGTVPIRAKANIVPRDRGMNRTEAKYAKYLDMLKGATGISDWRYEPIKFRLADLTTYTPDFMVINRDGGVIFTDTKAYWKKAGKVGVTEDAMVKMKVVADQYPWFSFCMAWEEDGSWRLKQF